MLDFTKLALSCLLCTAALGYEFEGGDESLDCDSILKNDRLVNGLVDCLMSDNPECGSVLFTQIKINKFTASMRKPVYAALFGLVILTNVFADDDGYDWFYEDYDYEPMLDNDRLMTGLVTCLLQDNECENPIFQLVKQYAPEILETVCGKCTDLQKEKFKQCVNKFIKIRPGDYEAILKKMDPDNKYKGPLEAYLAS